LPVEIEHKARWAINEMNLNIDQAGEYRKLEIQELEEIRNESYESAWLEKLKLKERHDKKLIPKNLERGLLALLFNSRAKLFPGKLKSKWSGPYVISDVNEFGAVTLYDMKTKQTFQVNGQRVKLYYDGCYLRDKKEQVPVEFPEHLLPQT